MKVKLNKMGLFFTKYLNYNSAINLLLSALPLSFIAGNLSINLNIILIIFVTIFKFKENFFKFQLELVDKILIIFFIYAIFIGSYNYYIFPEQNNIYVKENLIKSFAFLRYLLFYISIKLIVKNKIFNFKLFFIVSSLSVVFVSLDIIYQLIFGKDILGNLKTPQKLSGPFGSEQIAGSYLQRFSIFLFFLAPLFLNFKNKNYSILVLSLIFFLIFFSMIIAGNRMPLILFVIMFFILFLMEKKLRKFSFLLISLTIIIFLIVFKMSPLVQDYTQYFLRMSIGLFIFLKETLLLGLEPNITNTYIKEFYSGYLTWKENLIFGGGINFFYINCAKTIEYCASHPHNYYLEILTELGIIGFLIIFLLIINLFIKFIQNKNSLNLNFYNNLNLPFALLLFIEFFPIKTSGSFFTTGNTTFIFFLIAIVANLPKKYIPIE